MIAYDVEVIMEGKSFFKTTCSSDREKAERLARLLHDKLQTDVYVTKHTILTATEDKIHLSLEHETTEK